MERSDEIYARKAITLDGGSNRPGAAFASTSRDFSGALEPKVSVITPAYNATKYICDALESIFAQTYQDFEVIVINDGSPDTEEFEQAIKPYRDRIVYLKQANRGPSAARNAGILRARGEYVAFLDSDDAWHRDYLAEQMNILRESPSLDLTYSDVLHYTESVSAGTPYSRKCPSNGPVTFESLLREDVAIPTSQVVVRKRAVADAGWFDEELWRAEDFDLWLRLAYQGAKITYQKKLLGRHRVRSESLAGDNIKMLAAMIQVLLKLERSVQLPADTQALLRQKIAQTQAQWDIEQGKFCLYHGRFQEAAELFEKANGLFRRTKLRLILLGLKVAPRLTSCSLRIFEHWRTRWNSRRAVTRKGRALGEASLSKLFGNKTAEES